MSMLETMRQMMGDNGVMKHKTFTEIRELVTKLHAKLDRLEVLRPQPWRWYRMLGGQRALTGCPDRDGDFTVFVPEANRLHTVHADGTPFFRDLGSAVAKLPPEDWCLLVADLGPAFSENHLLGLADEVCEAVMSGSYEDPIRSLSQKYLEARRYQKEEEGSA